MKNKKKITEYYFSKRKNIIAILGLLVLIIITLLQIKLGKIVPRVIDQAYANTIFIDSGNMNSIQIEYYKTSVNLISKIVGEGIKNKINYLAVMNIILIIPLVIIYWSVVEVIKNIFIKINNFWVVLVTIFTLLIKDQHFAINEYPLSYITEHTFGLYGLAFSLLQIKLGLSNNWATLGFATVITILIHPVIGVFSSIVMLHYVTFFILKNKFKGENKNKLYTPVVRIVYGITLGIIITYPEISELYSSIINKINAEYDYDALTAYMKFWDVHRNIKGISLNYLINTILLIMGGLMLRKSKFINKYKLYDTIFILTLVLIIYLLKPFYPRVAIDLMLFRLPLIVAPLSSVLYFIICATLIITAGGYICEYINHSNIKMVKEKYFCGKAKLIFVVIIGLALLIIPGHIGYISKIDTKINHYKSEWLKTSSKKNVIKDKDSNMKTYENSKTLEGLAVTVSSTSRWAVLKLKVPILLDISSFDFIPYLPQKAKELSNIIIEVYSIDFYNPPLNIRNKSSIPDEQLKEIFESRTKQEWKKLSIIYGFELVVVPKAWDLNLNILKNNEDEISVYKINY